MTATAPTGRAHNGRLAIVALMGCEAASLAAMSALHLTGTLAGGARPFNGTHAGIAEALICLGLAAGAITLARSRDNGWTAALAGVAFAIVGFLVGLTFTIRGGDAVGIGYHATVLPLLLATLVLLVRNRSSERGTST